MFKIPHFGLKRQYNNLREELLVATDEALRNGCLISGPFTHKFEEWLRLYCGTWYAITVHSGTQALEIMARYQLTKHADTIPQVTVPNITYPATLNAFINAGWDIRIGDTDKNGLLDMSEHHNSYKCFVGLYGATHDNQLGASVFVDGAQHWLVAQGNVGLGMAISFDPTKNLPSSGNGGAIVTNDEDLYRYAVDYRNNGKMMEHCYTGTNSKMSELDCAHLLVRSKYIDEWQARREKIRKYYIEQFKDLPIRCLSDGFLKHADQKFVIAIEERDRLHGNLILDGIETKIHYEKTIGELMVARNLSSPDMISTSLMLSRMVLSLPIYPELKDAEVEYIAGKIRDFYTK
jgi:dTDP-4-amino-4,6-dideoxygalactose transaminase